MADFTLAFETSTLYCAVLNSLSEIIFCSCRSLRRAYSAAAWRCSASARSSWARDDDTAAFSSVLSTRAMTWPAFTWSLKSTSTASTMPLTCVPTCTVCTGCRFPVAATTDRRSPFVISTRRYVVALAAFFSRTRQAP